MRITTMMLPPQRQLPQLPQLPQQPPPPPPPEEPPPSEEGPGQKLIDNMLNSPEFAKQLVNKMGSDGETVITVEGKEVVKISRSGPSLAEKITKGSQMFITAAAEEASKIVQSDPAFAFKESALGVKGQVYNGLPKDVQTVADGWFLPMLRVVALMLDVKKLQTTLANKDAPTIDKIVDGVHVATDVVGLVGAVGHKVFPALAPIAPTLTAIGLAGDIAAYSYHVLNYLKERGQVN